MLDIFFVVFVMVGGFGIWMKFVVLKYFYLIFGCCMVDWVIEIGCVSGVELFVVVVLFVGVVGVFVCGCGW